MKKHQTIAPNPDWREELDKNMEARDRLHLEIASLAIPSSHQSWLRISPTIGGHEFVAKDGKWVVVAKRGEGTCRDTLTYAYKQPIQELEDILQKTKQAISIKAR